MAVDLTPAAERPYVGSSGNNSVLNLALGYNGLERLTGMGGSLSSLVARLTGGGGRVTGGAPGGGPRLPNGNFPNGAPPGRGANFRGAGGGGFPGTGQPGALRLFIAPLSKEVSWLLPFGLFTLALLALRDRLSWPLAPRHRAAVLWGGWLIAGAVFFSVAGFFHEYYLSMLAPPLALLVGIGVAELWRLRERHPWVASGLLLLAALATLGLQYATAATYVRFAAWLAIPLALLVLGAFLLGLSSWASLRRTAMAGTAAVVAALLFTPGVWAGLTTVNTSSNQSLPAAYGGESSGPANRGNLHLNQSLLNYLLANTQGVSYLMAVPSSMQGADYVIATGRPVLYLGGFMGQDEVVTNDQLAQLVADGQLRYVYWSAGGRGGPGFGAQSHISSWVSSHCTPVQGFETTTRNAGAPDGTGGTTASDGNGAGGRNGFGGDIQVSLYDCGG